MTLSAWEWRDAVVSPDGPPDAIVRMVLVAIAKHVNKSSGRTFVSVPTIAACAHVCVRSVQKAIKRAVAWHWLHRLDRMKEEGRIYFAPLLPGERGSPGVHVVHQGGAPECTGGVHHVREGVNHVRTDSVLDPEGEIAAAPPLHASQEEARPATAAEEVERAIDIRLAEDRARGKEPDDEDAWRAGLRKRLKATEVAKILARADKADSPAPLKPTLTAEGKGFYDRLMVLGDEAMNDSAHELAEAIRREARKVRESGRVPTGTPESLVERVRRRLEAQRAQPETKQHTNPLTAVAASLAAEKAIA